MEQERPVVIRIRGVKKKYTLGQFNASRALSALRAKWSRLLGREASDKQKKRAETWRDFYALKGLDLDVRQGDSLGIIGLNGSGKSTLLKIISRITAPTEGEIGIRGRSSSMLEIGTGFNPDMTGRENIYLNGTILGMKRAEIAKKIDSIIDFSECRDFIDTPVKRYSSGMYVRLAFSVAAFLDSEILIMDEVLAVGDAHFQKKCIEKMYAAAHNENRTVLFVSHNMNAVRELCSRCIVLEQGKKVFDGSVDGAIAIYSDINRKRNAADAPILSAGENAPVSVTEAKILNQNPDGTFVDENLNLYLAYQPLAAIDGVHLQVIFKEASKLPVGMCYVPTPLAFAPGAVQDGVFSIDLSTLAFGKYTIDLVFLEGELGNCREIARFAGAVTFQKRPVILAGALSWPRENWGTAEFPFISPKMKA